MAGRTRKQIERSTAQRCTGLFWFFIRAAGIGRRPGWAACSSGRRRRAHCSAVRAALVASWGCAPRFCVVCPAASPGPTAAISGHLRCLADSAHGVVGTRLPGRHACGVFPASAVWLQHRLLTAGPCCSPTPLLGQRVSLLRRLSASCSAAVLVNTRRGIRARCKCWQGRAGAARRFDNGVVSRTSGG